MLPEVLPYQLKVCDYFRSHASTWEYFAAESVREEQLAAFQTDLLKNAQPFSREEEPGLFGKIDRARAALELADLRVTAYRAAGGPGNELNVRVIYRRREAQLLFMGPMPEKPDEQELLTFIVHELALVRLYTLMNGEVEIASRIITSIANHPQSDRVCLETARLFSLYTEIYCDRCAYIVMGDPTPVTNMLMKLSNSPMTGNAGTAGSAGRELRKRALDLWHSQGEAAMPAITKIIEGVPDLDHLDLFIQRELNDLTYDFLQEYLRPEWMRTELITALQRQYFPRGAASAAAASGNGTREVRPPEQVAAVIAGLHRDIRSYFGYVLLDFCRADPSLKDRLSGRALEFAGEMQLSDVYNMICKKELSKD